MGKESLYRQEGGFSEYTYKTIGVITDGNITGKVIEPYDSEDHQSLPLYSNTSKIYFRKDTNTGRITQMRIYVDRKAAFDIEWGQNMAHSISAMCMYMYGTKIKKANGLAEVKACMMPDQ